MIHFSPSLLDHSQENTYQFYYWPTWKKSLKSNIHLKLLNHFSAPLCNKFSWKICHTGFPTIEPISIRILPHHSTKIYDFNVSNKGNNSHSSCDAINQKYLHTSDNFLLCDSLFLLDFLNIPLSPFSYFTGEQFSLYIAVYPHHLPAI